MNLVTVLGARPQFVKAGSVSREIAHRAKIGSEIREVIVHTGQHYDVNLSDVFFDEMSIPKPDYLLGIGGKSHGAMTGQMIEKIEAVLVEEDPDMVMVYGDTNSTLAAAIAASKIGIRIAHVEAGLRSYNIRMPEEINRILTDRVSSLLFCPTQAAVENLKKEGCDNWQTGARVLLSGDVMLDGATYYRDFAKKLNGLSPSDGFVLCTIHRAENTDDPQRLDNIISALNDIAKQQQVVLPMHPRTKKMIMLGDYDTSRLTIVDPVGYLNMVWLIDNCSLVMTDSGGLQKEAFFFKRPCITLRDETEWVETVSNSFNHLTGADKERILDTYENADFNTNFDVNLFGDGRASQNIVSKLLEN